MRVMPNSRLLIAFLVFFLCCLGSLAVIFLSPLHQRLSWSARNTWVSLVRWLNPPQQLVFIPQQGATPGLVETLVQLTMTAVPATQASPTYDQPLALSSLTETAIPASTRRLPSSTPAPTLTSTALPERIMLEGVRHEPQQFNNCGPASLSMALSYWGWQGNQNDTRLFLRPNRQVDDKNVSPSEMVTFAQNFTGLQAVTRVGGDLQTLKRFLASGFPLLIEEGHDPQGDWWMGHYLVITGYDDISLQFISQDSLLGFSDAKVSYQALLDHWRDFNFVYLVIYPPERQQQVFSLLGAHAEVASAWQAAAVRAQAETTTLKGRPLFFAWFNLGASLAGQQQYEMAAQAFDQAFAIYARLPEDKTHPDSRPFRLMWYRFEPYEAYYHTRRYQDVIKLADTTFMWVGRPVLEESFYWRALAYQALGDTKAAVSDLNKALDINPNFAAAQAVLESLQTTPEGG